jgi:carbonic anhydrase/acetyltransferase-like protein (isoleucine patch superfamily)
MAEHPESSDLKAYCPHRYLPPKIDPSVFLAPGSHVLGDVHIGKDSSLWFNAVLRGDVNYIRVGERTNIQDGSIVHVSYHGSPTIIGDDVTIGHGVILHACTIRNFALIGMGSLILDEVEVGELSLIGAGSLLTQGTKIPPRMKAFGRPAKVVGPLSGEELERLRWSAGHYMTLARTYRDARQATAP